jgi:ABC-type lipoprotein export system ATPase subunit
MKFIELREVCKTYKSGQVSVPVLKGVSLTVDRGEFVALMGASGSGKSTLMNILGCLDRPSSGSYWLDGQDVSGLSPDQRARLRNRMVGFIFQSFNLLPRTSALENVAMPLSYAVPQPSEKEARRRAAEMLCRVGLGHRLDHEPSRLSGGEHSGSPSPGPLWAGPLSSWQTNLQATWTPGSATGSSVRSGNSTKRTASP